MMEVMQRELQQLQAAAPQPSCAPQPQAGEVDTTLSGFQQPALPQR